MQKHVDLTSKSRLPTKNEINWKQSTFFNLFTYYHSDKKKKKQTYFLFLILKTHFCFPGVHEKWINI